MARAESIDDLLRRLGVGPWQAADRAGVAPDSVRAWIAGTRKMRNEQAERLAAALGVGVERVLAAAAVSRRRA